MAASAAPGVAVELGHDRVIATITVMTFSASGAAPTPLYHQYQESFGLTPFTVTIIFAADVLSLLMALLTVGSLSHYIGRLEALTAHGTGEQERVSAGRLASIGSKYLSGDERCFFGSKKDGGTRDLGWVADAPKRYALGQCGLPLRGSGEAVEHAGLDRTRRNGINAYT